MSKTSSAVKNRYKSKVYKRIAVELKKDFVEEFELKLSKDGISKADFFRRAIKNYLEEVPAE